MNIFVTDESPKISAINLDDKRLVKMVLETTQILCTVLNEYGVETPYKSTHINHPCTIWAKQNRKNFLWLLKHGYALCAEYSNRFEKLHKCEMIIRSIDNECVVDILPVGLLQPFVNCTTNKNKGISFKHIESPIEAYRAYLSARWDTDTRKPKWTKIGPPEWYRGIYA